MDKPLQIALIGSAPSSVRIAPYASPEWQIWACSPGAWGAMHSIGVDPLKRVAVWWELHRYEPGQPWFSPEYCDFLSKHPRVMMAEQRKEIPGAVRVPREELVAEFGPYFFTSSLAYMFAMAMKAGATKIGMWGVDMSACPHPDTRVLRADLTWVRAGDLRVGDSLVAFDEEPVPNGNSTCKRMYRKAEVINASAISKPSYRIYFEDGTTQICSDEHKWLVHSEHFAKWKMTKDLVTPHHRPDRPTRVIKLCDVWEEDKSWDAGYLAAAIDGEGHLSQKLREGDYAMLRIGFAQRENGMSAQLLESATRLGFEFGIDSSEAGVNGNVTKYSLRGGRAKTMEFLGRIRPRRLIDKFDPALLGIMQKQSTVAVERIEYLGHQPVVGLTTSTGTFIAEGLATHNTEEYGYQRAGLQFFGMLGRAAGIEVGVPPESDLFRPPPLYGISEIDHDRIKFMARRRELSDRKAAAEARIAQATAELQCMHGALDDMTWVENTWAGTVPGHVYVEPPVATALRSLVPSSVATQ